MTVPARVAFPLALLLAACSDSDAVAIRVKMNPDGSGTIAASALLVPSDAAPFETKTRGVDWAERANLYCAKGAFKSLAELQVAGIRFSHETSPSGVVSLRTTLPFGPQAPWCAALAPSVDKQRQASGTLDPSGKVTTAGTLLKLEIEVPGTVAAVGIAPDLRGATVDKFKERATLVVPIQRVLESAETEVVFDVTWRKK